MGLALLFSFTFPMVVYTPLSIAAISIVRAPFYRKSSTRGSYVLLLSAFVGVLPLAYIWVMDVASANTG
jgi:hypothetical protein